MAKVEYKVFSAVHIGSGWLNDEEIEAGLNKLADEGFIIVGNLGDYRVVLGRMTLDEFFPEGDLDPVEETPEPSEAEARRWARAREAKKLVTQENENE